MAQVRAKVGYRGKNGQCGTKYGQKRAEKAKMGEKEQKRGNMGKSRHVQLLAAYKQFTGRLLPGRQTVTAFRLDKL